VRGHLVAIEAACDVMLGFEWDSLRRGDHVLFHDAAAPDLGLRPGIVALVNAIGRRRDIAVRYTDGPDAGRVVRPGRFATHLDPLTDAAGCWRCAEAKTG
jgi:hypothetical protein